MLPHNWVIGQVRVPNLQCGLVHNEPLNSLRQFLKLVILLSDQLLVLQQETAL